ncbi:Uncharacterised protein [Segatella copri]|nr:Uncharacterised protein [Segatella copri]
MTFRTCFWLGTTFATCSVTCRASYILANLEALGNTCCCLLESQFYSYAKVATLVNPLL